MEACRSYLQGPVTHWRTAHPSWSPCSWPTAYDSVDLLSLSLV